MNAAERAKAAIGAAAEAIADGPEFLRLFIETETRPDWWAGSPMTLLLAGNIERAARRLEARAPESAALCRAAASACVEAWQESRERAEVREELLTVLRETSINQDLGFSIDEPGDVESLGCAVSDYAFRGSNKALRPACSRAAIALLHWRERMVDGE